MAYFCEKTGRRTCAPGVSVNAGGHAPNHHDTERHHAAEAEAARALGDGPPNPQALLRATDAAVGILGGPQREAARPQPRPEHEDERRGGKREGERAGERLERPKKGDPKAPPAAALEEPSPPNADAPAADAPATQPPNPPAAG